MPAEFLAERVLRSFLRSSKIRPTVKELSVPREFPTPELNY